MTPETRRHLEAIEVRRQQLAVEEQAVLDSQLTSASLDVPTIGEILEASAHERGADVGALHHLRLYRDDGSYCGHGADPEAMRK